MGGRETLGGGPGAGGGAGCASDVGAGACSSEPGRPAYHRLRAQGRNPTEMRIGLNMIRITAEAEREWQQLMQEPNEELEQQAVEQAVKAGEAAVKSDKHISKKRTAGRGRP